MLFRALLVSNLVTIHLKTGIGTLSAYCGATSAGAGAGAGICYLYGGRYKEIAHTIVNALAINSGMLCDGAKASCAAKIASAVEAGMLGMRMYMHDSQFYGGDGIVVTGVENTIRAVSTIARDGMLGGADVALYRRLQDRFPGVTFTASGGIGSVADIRALESAGIPRVIVGKALYEFVRDYARSAGCHNITLNVWKGNDAAIHFYTNMGMQVQKTTMETLL